MILTDSNFYCSPLYRIKMISPLRGKSSRNRGAFQQHRRRRLSGLASPTLNAAKEVSTDARDSMRMASTTRPHASFRSSHRLSRVSPAAAATVAAETRTVVMAFIVIWVTTGESPNSSIWAQLSSLARVLSSLSDARWQRPLLSMALVGATDNSSR